MLTAVDRAAFSCDRQQPSGYHLIFSRRKLFQMAAGAAAMGPLPVAAAAGHYPTRPVRIVVGFAPGGGQDRLARLIGIALSERLGQQFIVENRPGAGTNLATEYAARAPANGYTLLLVGPQNAINATLYAKLNFNFLHDFAPIASISREANIMVVNPAVKAKTVPELIAYAKANPGKINMASAGIGSAGHVAGELFEMMTGTAFVHVPYHGLAPALTDLMGGRTDICFANLSGAIGFVRAGKLRALAVTTAKRSDVLPDVPAVNEFVPGYEASSLFGLAAPRNTPAEVITKLNAEVDAALAEPKIKTKLAEEGASVLRGSPGEFGKLLADETAKWGKVIAFAKIKPE
jgi:tripartite-type tricarboxylate transporter receptor subunit TctC